MAPFLKRSAFLFIFLSAFTFFGSHAMAASAPQIHVSNNWAGYAATSGTYTAVSGSWTIPASTKTSNVISADAEWVGIGGISDNDLIQAGTQSIIRDGQTQYTAWYEILPDTQRVVPLTVNPGDQMSVSLNETSTNLWHIAITDLTTNQTYQTNVTYVSSHSSAEWIVERPLAITSGATGYLPLSDFGNVTFTNPTLTANGVPQTLDQAQAEQLLMSSSNSRLIAAPQMDDNGSFSVAYLSSSQSSSYLRALRREYTLQPETNVSSRSPHYQEIQTSYIIHVIFGLAR